MTDRTATVASLAVCAVVVGLVALAVGQRKRANEPARHELARLLADGQASKFSGQLSFGVIAPAGVMRGAAVDTDFRLVATASRIIAKADSESAESLYDAGIAYLVLGKVAAAAQNLEEVARRTNDSAAWSDLAAARLTECEQTQAFELCVDAVAAADAALARDPDLSAAKFNRTAALEQLGFVSEPSRPTPSWNDVLRRLETAAANDDRATVAHFVRAYSRDARAWAEGVYPAMWSDAVHRGDAAEARRCLLVARSIGRALDDSANERLARDAVAVIENADGSEIEILSRAYDLYRRGRIAHGKLQPTEAEQLLRHAEELFTRVRSPMALVARYYIASAMYVQLRISEAAAILDDLASKPLEPNGYRALAAQIGWERGLSLLLRGHYSAAVGTFQRSAAMFAALEEPTNRATMEDFLADALEFMGDPSGAWNVRRQAIDTFSRSGNVDRLLHSLTTTINARMRRKEWSRARALLNVSIDLATRADKASLAASALLQRAIVASSMAEDEQARSDLAEATRWIAAVKDERVAGRLEAERAYAEGMTLRDQPQAAIGSLTRAHRYFHDNDADIFTTLTLLQRARAYRKHGDLAAARDDLDDALAVLEQQRESITDIHQRATMFGTAAELFDEAIDVALVAHDDAAAFALTERARGRALLELMDRAELRSPSFLAKPLSLIEIQRALDNDAAVIQYRALHDRLVVFVVRPDALHVLTRPIAAAELQRRVASCSRAVQSGSAEAAPRACESAARELLTPLRDALDRVQVAAVVADRTLAEFPFAMSHVWGLGVDVVESPSASLAIECSRRAASRPLGDALVISSTDFDRQRFSLEPLRHTRSEAAAVAGIWRTTNVLEGAEVTKRRIVDALPRYGIVHFAGHALADARQPAASQLVISSARVEDDLTASTIATMSLGRMNLAYLSACRSGGSSGRTDGIENLAIAFLVAGAPSVIASRWDIDDEAAAGIAATFHRAFVQSRDPASAIAEIGSAGLAAIGGTPRLVNAERRIR